MGFLQNIFGKGGKNAAEEFSEMPTRNRTFSASAFRDAEVARENEAYHRREQAQLDASTVLSPAVAPVAEVLMAQQEEVAAKSFQQEIPQEAADQGFDEAECFNEPEDFAETGTYDEPQSNEDEQSYAELRSFDDTPSSKQPISFEPAPMVEPAPAVQDEPMAWDEAVGWLSQRSAESCNFVAQYWNWEHDLRVIEFLVRQPDLDPGVAAGILWLTAANEDYFPWGDDEPQTDFDRTVAKIADLVGRRFDAGEFPPMAHGFDDSWDCDRLKERLVDLFNEGRIDWNPGDLPTSSAAPMMGFDDIPADERDEVVAFLARHGVR